MSEKSDKLGLYDCYKIILDGKEEDLERIPSSLMFPLIRWFSFARTNVNACQMVNRYFKWVDYKVLRWLLYFKIDTDKKFIKYLKYEDSEKFDFLRDYLKKYFGYSEREYLLERQVIDKLMQSQDFKKDLNGVFGFSQKECKDLGLEYKKEKIEKRVDTGSKSLFSFAKK